ncbi:MAG TPA: phytanoyl-CoA dioxygenase family protein [Acetobacteraceae bacterium]|nr:phytanoyl-CoA dioxygenase family protein [Acetobacteraceae bacterium]
MTLKSYGATATADAGDDPLARALEELSRNGFTVLEQVISATPLAALCTALDRLLAAQTDRFGGSARLDTIGDAGQARALLEEEPVFLDLLRLPRLDAIIDALLGPAALVMQQNGIVMPPAAAEHHQQSWHRDLPYQSWIASKPLALGALAALDDFTAESGATRFLPGSHRHETLPSAAYVARWAHQAVAPAGSVVVFDAMCFHAGGVNRGSQPRRAVNTLFGIPLLAQQVTFTGKPGLDAKLRRRLGLDYQPAPNVDAWRARRAARLGGGDGQ